MNNIKQHMLICSHTLEIGGAERSLIDMLRCIDYNRFDVDLFLYKHEGIWMNEIPEEVNLLPEDKKYASLKMPMIGALKAHQYGVLAGRLAGRFHADLFVKFHKLRDPAVSIENNHRFTRPFLPKINPSVHYDLAISFLIPHYFVIEKVNAKKKMAWIHTDYAEIDINEKSEFKMWSKYDYIASISDNCTEGFLKKFPSLKDKIILIENVLSTETIKNLASCFIPLEMSEEKDAVKLLTIGRYTRAKNIDQIPEMCRKILDSGLNIKWYIIGYGGDYKEILENIDKFHVKDKMILLGKQENPYPYIKNCDVYIQPSRYEGKSVAVREAQILNKPVIITNYATSSSQLTDGFDGLIVPLGNDECAAAIVDALRNPELLKQLAENTKSVDYSNRSELEKLYALI